MNKLVTLICFTLFPFFLLAQNEYPDMATDRPDQTESAEVVPLHSLQIETGFVKELSKTDDVSQVDYAFSSTLLRYGLLNRFELRLGFGYLGRRIEDVSDDGSNGIGALSTGFKYKILAEDGLKPGIAFLGNLAFPFIASDEFKSNHTAAGIRFSLSQSLSDRFSLGYNLGSEWDGNSSAAALFYSVSLGIGLTDRLGMFIESYGLLPRHKADIHLLDAGFTYLIIPNLQADVSGGIGLNDSAIDHFISFGLSFRLPGSKRSK